jgi:hypothetical protein
MQTPRYPGLERRELLMGGLALTITGVLPLTERLAAWGALGPEGAGRGPHPELSTPHLPRITAPHIAPTGSVVPVVVSLDHPWNRVITSRRSRSSITLIRLYPGGST